MPIFEYKCDDCGKVSSVLVRSGSGKEQKCPDCGSSKMEKQMSTFTGMVKEPTPATKCGGCAQAGTCPNAIM